MTDEQTRALYLDLLKMAQEIGRVLRDPDGVDYRAAVEHLEDVEDQLFDIAQTLQRPAVRAVQRQHERTCGCADCRQERAAFTQRCLERD